MGGCDRNLMGMFTECLLCAEGCGGADWDSPSGGGPTHWGGLILFLVVVIIIIPVAIVYRAFNCVPGTLFSAV